MAETNGISYTTLLPYQNGRVSEFIANENNGNGTGRFDENRKEARKNKDNDSGIDEKIGNLWHMHKRTAKRVELAKRKARSELQKCGWQSMGFAHESIGHELNPDWQAQFDTIQRVDASEMTYEQFVEQFERPGIPVILTGLTSGWRANERWDFRDLLRGYRNQKFKCGEDDDGYSVKLKMKYYLDYMFGQGMGPNMDDSPLYIFDSGFGDRPKTAKMLSDYEVPPMFKDDLFRYASEKRRPPYRWFVMGPTRSGTGIHIDPLGTSAWNALIKGHKKWCLIDPRAPKHLVKPERKEAGDHPDEAVAWFSTVDRRIMEKDPAKWPYYLYTVIHAIQRPGDVMFVPSGWWHVVMNLDHTVAVTQNFCSITNLHKVWPKTMKSRPQLALHWLKALKRERPELIPRIEEINQKNGLKSLDIREPCDSSSSSSSESDESSSESDDGDGETGNSNWNEIREGERPQNDGNFDITKMRDVDHRPFPPSLQFLHEQFRQTEKNRKNEQQNVPNSLGEGNRKRKLGHCEGRNKSASPPAAYRHNNPKQQQNPI